MTQQNQGVPGNPYGEGAQAGQTPNPATSKHKPVGKDKPEKGGDAEVATDSHEDNNSRPL
jgi:hypothetical protein